MTTTGSDYGPPRGTQPPTLTVGSVTQLTHNQLVPSDPIADLYRKDSNPLTPLATIMVELETYCHKLQNVPTILLPTSIEAAASVEAANRLLADAVHILRGRIRKAKR